MKRTPAHTASVIVASLLVAGSTVTSSSAQVPPTTPNRTRPVYQLSAGYVSSGNAEGDNGEYGSTTLKEFDATWAVAYYWDIVGGNIDVSLHVKTVIIPGSCRALRMPDQLVATSLNAEWTREYNNGVILQIGAMPGIYSDLEEIDANVAYLPVSWALSKSLGPQLSCVAGMLVRPGFETLVIPRMGVDWSVTDELNIKAQVPETKITYCLNRCWTTHLAVQWQNTSYSLREKSPYNREQVTIEDYRATLGLTRQLSDQWQLTGELGHVFERTLEFKRQDRSPDKELELDDAYYIGFALAGPF